MIVATWIAIVLIALEALIMVSRVGKPRPTYTGGMAVASLVEYAFIGFVLIWWVTQ